MSDANSSDESGSANSHRESESYLPAPETGELFIEIPVSPVPYFIQESLPDGNTPMGEIAAEGELYRGLSSPYTPRWVTLASWPVLGLPTCVSLGLAIAEGIAIIQQAHAAGIHSADFGVMLVQAGALLVAVFLSALVLVVLAKGTLAQIKRSQR
ncbi:MAG TPA: hypothetical protein V6D06_01390 [Trichocoleus sp.]